MLPGYLIQTGELRKIYLYGHGTFKQLTGKMLQMEKAVFFYWLSLQKHGKLHSHAAHG